MGQEARLRLIRDRFIAGHESCDLRRYLDCVPPDTPLRDIVDRCRVWESHSDSPNIPMPEPVYPTYVVNDPDYDAHPARTVPENKPESSEDASNELLRKLVAILTPVAPAPARAPESSVMDKLAQLLMERFTAGKPVCPAPTELEKLQTYFEEKQLPNQQFRPRPVRRNWSDVKCFSCGKTGHSAARCPTLNVAFPFILPGWKAEKTSTGYLMISPKMASDRRRAENED